jgi:hypothetical protein
MRDKLVPNTGTERSSARTRFELAPRALKLRKVLTTGAVVLSLLLIFGLAVYFAWRATPPPAPAPQPPSWAELVQSDEWRSWRKQIHEKLSADNVTEMTLADALRNKLPARPDDAPAALRRDQAIAEVLMSYPRVRNKLWDRFGIDEKGFLGTGLSKPVGTPNYGAAAVHEYLIPNLADRDPAVWMRILDPNNPDDMRMTVRELFENDPKADDKKNHLVAGIAQRVKENDPLRPAVIRFQLLYSIKYSGKLGPLKRHRVFASNLAELWNSRVEDAARLSGYTFTEGDSVYVWAFLPGYPDQVVPATWGDVLNHLPKWLSEIDTN